METTICLLKEGKNDNLSILSNLKDGRNVSFVNDKELEKRKVSRIPVNTKINSVWVVRSWAEWADVCYVKAKSVNRSLLIDMGRSDFSKIK